MMVIMLVGGGTGGHFFPLMAVAEELNNSDYKPKLYYIGPAPFDQDELEKHNIQFIYCPAGKLRRYFSLQNFVDVFRNIFGFFYAIFKLFAIYPDVIFSKGGYTSVPVLMAARLLRIPVVIHESDASPGLANKMAKSFAKYIGIAHPAAAQFFPPEKTALVGIPLRKEVTNIHPDPFNYLGIPNDLPLIYVTGGSSGAEKINNLILRSLPELLKKYRVFHQTGRVQQDELLLTAKALVSDQELQSRYYIKGFIEDREAISALLTASSLVITRAGSTSLFEIATHSKPSIIIPIPEHVSHDQTKNAYSYAHSGAALVMEEDNLTEHLLNAEVESIMNDLERQAMMSAAAGSLSVEDAAQKISSILLQIGINHGS